MSTMRGPRPTGSMSYTSVSYVYKEGVLGLQGVCPTPTRRVSYVYKEGVLGLQGVCPTSTRSVSYVYKEGVLGLQGVCPTQVCPMSTRRGS